ncbi:MAG: peptide ABC transporter substrate-binding protein [Candidatus Magasanikbacteria bacterium]|nr:peptide ABC transporter substrate-binding protein [Candidatus Magasanikbacteria bacterium]
MSFKSFFSQHLAKTTKKAKPLVGSNHDLTVLRGIHGKKRPTWHQLRHVKKVLGDKERRIFTLAIWGLLAGCLWLGVNVIDGNRVQVPKEGGRYVEAVVGAPQLINPLFASLNDVDVDLARLMYSGLMRFDANQELVADLADSYELSEDKKVYTFKLRQDISWHSGTKKEVGPPITASDIAFTIDLIQNQDVGSPLYVSFQGVLVEVIDEQTISFTLQEPFQPFLSSLTVGILPAHIWENIPAERIRLAQSNLQPVGSGPYVFKKLIKDQTGFISRYELEKNEQYHLGTPYIDEVIFQFFGVYDDPDVGAIQALRSQKVDGIHFVPAHLASKVERKHITVHTLQLPQYTALFFNPSHQSILEEDDLREALALAIDKRRILRESLQGEGEIIEGPILAGFPGYTESVTTTPYSIVKANELLDEKYDRLSAEEYRKQRRAALIQERGIVTSTAEVAQVEENEDEETATTTEEVAPEPVVEDIGPTVDEQLAQVDAILDQEIHEAQTFYRVDEDDNIIELSLVTVQTDEYAQAAQLIAGFWQELGIKTTISTVDPRQISKDVLKKRDYDILLYGVIVGSDPDQFPFWHSTQVAYPGLNLSQYVNRSVDELLEKARETDSAEQLQELYVQLQDTILEDRPAIFLHTPVYRYATVDDIKGFTVERVFHPADRFADVHKWYIKTKGKWQ